MRKLFIREASRGLRGALQEPSCLRTSAKCRYNCAHRKCKKECGQPCNTKPCEEPCQKTLQKCGHKCVGFCGEPCPKLCRICDFEELTDFKLLGFEEIDDARFVLLVDCGHSIEAKGLDQWMLKETNEIGVKRCPKCQTPIYNTNRYKDIIIIRVNKDIDRIKYKYFFSLSYENVKKEILDELDVGLFAEKYSKERLNILRISNIESTNKKRAVPDIVALQVCLFKARVLHKLYELQRTNKFEEVEVLLEFLLKKAMNVQQRKLSPQFSEEINCELRRLTLLPALKTLKDHADPEMDKIRCQIDTLMDPSLKFDEQLETKVLALLKESERYVVDLGLTDEERMQPVSVMGFKQGHWYKCPNGHVCYIGECGGVGSEAVCPTCKAKICGTRYNTLETDLDLGVLI